MIIIQTWWPKQQAVPNVVHKQLWQNLHLIKKNAVTKLIASAVIQQFLKFDYQKTKFCCQVLNPTPALQAATILVAMASEKNIWRLKF